MKIADELRIALNRAMEDAKLRRHEFLTLEHILLSLLKDPESAQMLKACGGKLRELERQLEQYLNEEVDTLPETLKSSLQIRSLLVESSKEPLRMYSTAKRKPSPVQIS